MKVKDLTKIIDKKINPKIFITLLISIISIFLLYHIVLWHLYTSKIFDREDELYVGDVGRMSYQVDSLYPRKMTFTLNKKIINHEEYRGQEVDIITIGDSFSNGGGGGLNPYYQDYIATRYNKNILNIARMANGDHTPFELVLILYNTGWLKQHKPSMIIVESSVREVYNRFAKEFDFSYSDNDARIFIDEVQLQNPYIPKLLMINTANYKLPFYTIKYNFNDRAFKTVVKTKLNKNLFSTKNYENTLLFHYDDVTRVQNNTQKVKLLNDNFNQLASLLKPLNIKLVFMPAVDKYDLYSEFIENNPYQKNDFFDIIRPLKKEYLFLDTKKILLPLLQNGEKDIYYSDDTHWSYKSSQEIARRFNFE